MVADRAMSVITDMDPNGRISTGQDAIREAIARRILDPGGSRYYAPGFGLGLSRLVGRNYSVGQIKGLVTAQLREDERVESATVEVTRESGTTSLDIVARTTEGDVELTVAIPPTAATLLGDDE
jgi:phage baseplate assembly protein W